MQVGKFEPLLLLVCPLLAESSYWRLTAECFGARISLE